MLKARSDTPSAQRFVVYHSSISRTVFFTEPITMFPPHEAQVGCLPRGFIGESHDGAKPPEIFELSCIVTSSTLPLRTRISSKVLQIRAPLLRSGFRLRHSA